MKINLFRLIRSSLIGVGLAVIILIFVVQPVRISGQSMQPTFRDGEYAILSKLSHTFNRLPEHGDVVAIDPRTNRNRSINDDFMELFKNGIAKIKGNPPSRTIWMKRVIGLPGDTIEFRDGSHVFRNGKPLEEPYIVEPMKYQNKHIYTVPDDAIFVLGDNRNHSVDSRYIGCVPINHVVGTIILKL